MDKPSVETQRKTFVNFSLFLIAFDCLHFCWIVLILSLDRQRLTQKHPFLSCWLYVMIKAYIFLSIRMYGRDSKFFKRLMFIRFVGLISTFPGVPPCPVTTWFYFSLLSCFPICDFTMMEFKEKSSFIDFLNFNASLSFFSHSHLTFRGKTFFTYKLKIVVIFLVYF